MSYFSKYEAEQQQVAIERNNICISHENSLLFL